MNDPISDALNQLRGIGLLVDDLKLGSRPDGRPWRCDVMLGSKKKKGAGWYAAHLFRLNNGREVVVGAYGYFDGAEKFIFAFKFDGRGGLSDAEKAQLKQRQKDSDAQAEQARIESAAEASRRATELWLKLPAEGSSEYLKRKGVRAWGLKFSRGAVVVPLKNVAGKMVGLQFIGADGGKKFISGTAKLGAWHLIGKIDPNQPLVLAEGYATGASIHEATGWPVAVCFDCGNLLPVAKALRSLYGQQRMLVAGDDDHEKPANAGREHGDKVAHFLKCAVVYPAFTDAAGRTDFNDLHAERGSDEVRTQLQAAIKNALPAGAVPADEEKPWQKQLVWTDDGLKVMVQNVMTILEHHPDWRDVFAYDDFQKRLVMRRAPPYGGKAGALTDGDEIEIAAWFGRKDTYRMAVPTLMAREASVAVGRRHIFHPVREYLEGCKKRWDGIDRIPTFFSDFCAVKQNEVTESFGLKFFISCVARIFQPGCRARLMLVLEGEQDINKSTLARVLCGEEYFADLGTAASDKDFFQIIQGRWIVEISELASFARSEAAHIKRAISTNIDRFRPSYGRNAEDFPRQCIFFGTVNNSAWQKDETGGTRFMPLLVTEVNVDAVRDIRDQLWAEAVVRYERGEDWWKLPEAAKEEQEARYEEDIWTHRIVKWLEGHLKGSDPLFNSHYASGTAAPIQVTSATEILSRVFDIELKKQDQALQMRIGRIMRRIGWERFLLREAGARIWKYRRKKVAGSAQPEESE